MCTLYMLLNTKHRQLCLKYKIDTIKTIRNCFTPPPTSTPTPPPPQSKKFRSGESIMAFLIEGRLCLAPIHPHTCQFHSNVSSQILPPDTHHHCTDVIYEGQVAGAPGCLMTITEPYHNCML